MSSDKQTTQIENIDLDDAEGFDYSLAQPLFEDIEKTGRHYDLEKIRRAYRYAKILHEGQRRSSGEPYICHPVEVARIILTLGVDTDSVCAALLHDTVEDCGATVEGISRLFGEDCAMLVDGVTKLVHIPFTDKEDIHLENLRKMFLAMSKDIRVIFIKLCDRVHNMRTLGARPPEKQRITALETMQVYAPIAHRLGMQKIKHELEEFSLRYLDPIGYQRVREDVDKRYGLNADFLIKARAQIEEKLRSLGFSFRMEGRVKSAYSIYRKMYEQGKSFDEIYDFYALRVITSTELECYTVLGVMHDMFKSMPGRFKDYISTPKPNMYRSLHTTVIGRDGIPFEVQIRTEEMDRVAEFGIAAHWKYKSGEGASSADEKLGWIAKIIESEDYTSDPDEFLRSLKIDLFHDETFVFTPKGDVVTLPQGSTLIDFAYAIHSAVGNKMTGAKINGMIAPIDSVPENGQIVEIITSSSSKGPSRDWLKIVKTAEARNKIRQYFKKEQRGENIVVGRAEVERELKKYGRAYTEAQKNEILIAVAERIGIHSVDDLYNTIGYGGLSVSKIALKLHDEFERVVKEPEEELPINPEDIITKPRKTSSGGVIIDGVEGCAVKFARCCNPLPGDSIIGFITKGYGVSIHRRDCKNVVSALEDPENESRFITAHWEGSAASSARYNDYSAQLSIIVEDRIKMLADISSALADMKVSIHALNTVNRPDGLALLNIVVGCRNLDHFKSIIAKMNSISGVVSVDRA